MELLMTEPTADAQSTAPRTTDVRTTDVRVLVEQIAKWLVEASDEVLVYQVEEDGETVIELEVAPDDMGKVIGKHGRTVRALRCLVNATGIRSRKRYALEILE
jgi:predicted RNA-binding protein YlqC (UPF0109 family)